MKGSSVGLRQPWSCHTWGCVVAVLRRTEWIRLEGCSTHRKCDISKSYAHKLTCISPNINGNQKYTPHINYVLNNAFTYWHSLTINLQTNTSISNKGFDVVPRVLTRVRLICKFPLALKISVFRKVEFAGGEANNSIPAQYIACFWTLGGMKDVIQIQQGHQWE